MAAIAGEPHHPLFVAHDQCWCDPRQECGKIAIGEPIVERAIRHTCQRCAKQRDNCCLAAFIKQRDIFSAALLDQLECAARGVEQIGISPELAVADKTDTVRRGLCCHLEEKRDIHLVDFIRVAFAQSDAGSGLASLVTSITPSTASEPLPGLTQSSSKLPAAST